MLTIKKFRLDDKYTRISLYIFIVAACLIVFDKFIGNLSGIGSFIGGFYNFFMGVFQPFVYGAFIAYFLNLPSKWFERVLFSRIKFLDNKKRIRRMISVLLTIFLSLGVITLILVFLVPQIISNIQKIREFIEPYLKPTDGEGGYEILLRGIVEVLNTLNSTFESSVQLRDIIDTIFDTRNLTFSSFIEFVRPLIDTTMSIGRGVLNFLIGLVVAFYFLCDKERYAGSVAKILYLLTNRRKAERVISVARNSNGVFEKFVIGKTIDSLIVAVIFLFLCTIFDLPFRELSTLIIGISNMVPYFGPFIGAVPVILITLMVNPAQALLVTVLIFVLQQLDGIILAPKILGDSTGLRPVEVLFAIIIGGSVMNILGMFFGVPVFAVIKSVLTGILNRKYAAKYYPDGVEFSESLPEGLLPPDNEQEDSHEV